MRHILYIFICLVFLSVTLSCNSEKKVYESGSLGKKGNKKRESSNFAITKYNKLLKSNDSDGKYDAAVNYFNKKEYSKAMSLFEDVISFYRGTAKAPEVQYYYAFCSFNLEDYIVAGYQFRTFTKNFPNSEHVELCAYMSALCSYQGSPIYSLDQSETETAMKEFQRFVNQYPNSKYVADCNEKFDLLRAKLIRKSYENAILYYNMGNYKSAIVAFDTHIKDFTETPHVEEFGFLTIKSYYLLAINSIEIKKEERFRAAINSYVKFVDKFPNSIYLKEAQNIYSESLKNIEKNNKSTS